MREKKNVPRLRFPGFTDEWEQRKLGDVIEDMYNGQTPSRSKAAYWNGDISWLSSGELNRGIVYESIEKITNEGKKSANLRVVPVGTFVMAITGLEASGTRGNCAILGFETTLNQSCMALFPKKEVLVSDFLFQWYRNVGEKYGMNYTQGTKQQSYNAELIKILPIVLPSIAEQKKISEILFKIDNLINIHQRKLEHTKDLKKSLLKKMFPKNGEKFPEVRFPGFTDAWEQRKVTELGEIYIGLVTTMTAHYTDKGTLLIRNSDIKDSRFEFGDNPIYLDEEFAKQNESRKHRIGDVITVHTGDIGTSAVITENEADSIGFATIVTRPDTSKITSNFLCIYLNTDKHKNFALGISTGDGRNNYNLKEYYECVVPVPCIDEQKKIGDYINTLNHLITLHQRELNHLQLLKKGLLQQMFV
jgi:type I restriction enzyme S subunit